MGTRGDFIGSGWGFPAAISRAGSVRLVSGAEELDAALRMILSTVPGERVMRPDFGCAMWSLVFDPLTAGTLGLIEQAVREAVDRWEPRVELDRVEAAPGAADGTVLIELGYRVRATNDYRNLVFPFYTIPIEEREQTP
jgi:phage baseplate assembly protein W